MADSFRYNPTQFLFYQDDVFLVASPQELNARMIGCFADCLNGASWWMGGFLADDSNGYHGVGMDGSGYIYTADGLDSATTPEVVRGKVYRQLR
jgi:hypothetical protein